MEIPSPYPPSMIYPPQQRHVWRWLLPAVLVLLFLAIMFLLPKLAQEMEATDHQEQLIADTLWVEQAIRFQMSRDEENIRLLAADISVGEMTPDRFRDRSSALLRSNHEFSRLAWIGSDDTIVAVSGMPLGKLTELPSRSQAVAARSRETGKARYAPPAPATGTAGPLLLDYFAPVHVGELYLGMVMATYRPSSILDDMVPWWFAQENEISLTDSDDNVIVSRASGGAGRNVYTHHRQLDLAGVALSLRTNSIRNSPRLLPNLLVGSVIVLSFGLLWSLWALWRDTVRRLAAEGALRQQVAFRAAMENSLLTGLRARDLEGRITYVNPAFCAMVGIGPDELIGKMPPMPYWAPEAIEVYQERFSQVLAGTVTPQFETIFQRVNGERFPVLIFESPLVDGSGKQTGWMGSILDISDRKRIEDLNRLQEEKLQSSARLASMGEIASTLAHELNQPLAAISSYTTGAINLLDSGGADPAMLRPALQKAGAQAQRAGQIIRSVHEFVKKREPAREPVELQALVENIIPLIELQARPALVSIQTTIARRLPNVMADRVMLEQVLLNLTRNGIEAMQNVPPHRRILRINARLDRSSTNPGVEISVTDQGHGIDEKVAARLFSPFFSTKAEGMGMGLNICRTAIEFHGGTLTYDDNPEGGTIFRFTLSAQSD